MLYRGGSVAEWLACWTQAQNRDQLRNPTLGNRVWVQIAVAMLSGNSLRQTVHTHRASVHQAAKLVAALLRVARVIAGLAESNGSLPPGLWLTSPAGWLPRTGISSGTLRSVIEYGLPSLFIQEQTTQQITKCDPRNSYRTVVGQLQVLFEPFGPVGLLFTVLLYRICVGK